MKKINIFKKNEPEPSFSGNKKPKKKICLVFCGGTIAMVPNKKTGALEPVKSVKEFLSLIPKIKGVADVDVVELFNIDSSDILCVDIP